MAGSAGPDRLDHLSLKPSDSTNLKDAAMRAGVSQATVVRWAKRYGIGRQIEPGAPWRINIPGLLMVAAADAAALDAYRAGDRNGELVARYLRAALVSEAA